MLEDFLKLTIDVDMMLTPLLLQRDGPVYGDVDRWLANRERARLCVVTALQFLQLDAYKFKNYHQNSDEISLVHYNLHYNCSTNIGTIPDHHWTV